jgi:putative thioredoxin
MLQQRLCVACIAALSPRRCRQGKPEEALNEAFTILKRDKGWSDGRARAFCVDVFNALGEGHPLVAQGRRRLSNILF